MENSFSWDSSPQVELGLEEGSDSPRQRHRMSGNEMRWKVPGPGSHIGSKRQGGSASVNTVRSEKILEFERHCLSHIQTPAPTARVTGQKFEEAFSRAPPHTS